MKAFVLVFGSLFFLLLHCQSVDGPRAKSSRTPAPTAETAAASPAQSPDASKLIEMLQDPLLWGPDYPEALNAIRALAQAGEERAEILPRQVIGRQKYATPAQAGAATSRANASLLNMTNAPRIDIAGMNARTVKPQIAAVVSADDRAVHVGTPDRPAQYIATNVKIDQVITRFGKPDRVTVEVIDDGTERRPIELTLYYWANDAIVVGTTDVSADPRTVERVVLDTNAVTRAIF